MTDPIKLAEALESACVFCPYTDDARWIEMRDTDPESFARACAADEALRDQSKTGLRRRAFVHRSLVPLRDVRFKAEEDNGLFGDGFGAECEGMCGI